MPKYSHISNINMQDSQCIALSPGISAGLTKLSLLCPFHSALYLHMSRPVKA